MTVEKWIHTLVGVVVGMMLSFVFLISQGVLLYTANNFMSSEFVILRILSWLLDISSGLLVLLVFFVAFSSLRKNKKTPTVIANLVLITTCFIYVLWWIFH
ncbi:hypothetical protein [Candidatus Uabimicrobium sp. HlEnr_7]|uniref:hypothetical protein n=1 Tax=Candidatus Uabimicrobium helgolandensis TaxID=3095367 RepID=UPI003557E9E2